MKIFKKLIQIIFFALLIAIGVLTTLWLFNAPEELPESTQSHARLNQSSYALATLALEFEDTSRSTPALGDFSGSESRKLEGTLWYPKQIEGKVNQHPLLVFSHGFGSFHKGSRHLAEYLARNGYVVAAVDFPLSHMRSPAGSPQLLDIVNQPGDVSAVIDHILALNASNDSPLFARIDADRIGAYGLSLGGLTTALVSYHPDYQDPRIKVAAMMAPPLQTFSNRFFDGNANIKSLVLSGSLDRVVPEQANAIQVQTRHLNGWFLSFDKGSHLGFANVGNPIRWLDNPDSLGCAMMDRMLSELELPDRWSEVLPNTNGVLIDETVPAPCPEINGKAMNGLKQQWLARIAIGSFFDMHMRDGETAAQARDFFTNTLAVENADLKLIVPR